MSEPTTIIVKKEKSKDDVEELEKVKLQRDDLQAQLQTLALEDFETQKELRLKQVADSFGEHSEAYDYVDEQIQQPADLERVDGLVDFLERNFEKLKQPAKPATRPAKPYPKSVVKLNAPRGSKEFADYAEMVSTYYQMLGSPDPEARAEAERVVGIWRRKLAEQMRRERTPFAISECPRCHKGIPKGEACQYCSWGQDAEGQKTLLLEKIEPRKK